MKDKAVEQLLNLHCMLCNGKTFDCRGCTKEEEIKKILEENTKTKKKTKKE